MTLTPADLFLASKSPRRAELLQQIGVNFSVMTNDVEEVRHSDESPQDYVFRLSLDKAKAGCETSNEVPVLGADTIVVYDGAVFEKPADSDEAVSMLERLSGQSHQVLTAVSIVRTLQGTLQSETRLVSTNVQMITLESSKIKRYVETGEPMDKAGAYGIQGFGAAFIQSIQGSYTNVVGLPLQETAQLLEHFNVSYWKTPI